MHKKNEEEENFTKKYNHEFKDLFDRVRILKNAAGQSFWDNVLSILQNSLKNLQSYQALQYFKHFFEEIEASDEIM